MNKQLHDIDTTAGSGLEEASIIGTVVLSWGYVL